MTMTMRNTCFIVKGRGKNYGIEIVVERECILESEVGR